MRAKHDGRWLGCHHADDRSAVLSQRRDNHPHQGRKRVASSTPSSSACSLSQPRASAVKRTAMRLVPRSSDISSRCIVHFLFKKGRLIFDLVKKIATAIINARNGDNSEQICCIATRTRCSLGCPSFHRHTRRRIGWLWSKRPSQRLRPLRFRRTESGLVHSTDRPSGNSHARRHVALPLRRSTLCRRTPNERGRLRLRQAAQVKGGNAQGGQRRSTNRQPQLLHT
jgi:hypothetical protein